MTTTAALNDVQVQPYSTAVQTLPAAEIEGAGETDDGFSFWDLLDVVNPLQHLPLISTVYREITGDTIKPLSNVIGGALFGGPIGFIAAAVESIVKDETGRTPGEHALAFVGLKGDAKPKTDVEVTELATSTGDAGLQLASQTTPVSPGISVAIPALLLEEARRDAARTGALAAGPSIQQNATRAPTAIGAPGQAVAAAAPAAAKPAPSEFYRTLQRGAPSEPAPLQKTNLSTGRVMPANLQAAQASVYNGAVTGQQAQQAQIAAQMAAGAGLPFAIPQAAQTQTAAPANAPQPFGRTPATTAPAAVAKTAEPQATQPPLPNPTAAASGPLPKELVADMMMAALNKYQTGKKADPSTGVLDITQ